MQFFLWHPGEGGEFPSVLISNRPQENCSKGRKFRRWRGQFFVLFFYSSRNLLAWDWDAGGLFKFNTCKVCLLCSSYLFMGNFSFGKYAASTYIPCWMGNRVFCWSKTLSVGIPHESIYGAWWRILLRLDKLPGYFERIFNTFSGRRINTRMHKAPSWSCTKASA